MRKTAGIIAAVAIAASALIAAPAHADAPVITAGGSSFSAGLFTTCAANYTDAKVTYTGSSSGTGRTNYMSGTFDFAGSDGAFGATEKQPAAADFRYIPVTGGPIAIAFNLDGVASLRLDAATTGAIFLGKIKTWNDAAIAALNPGVKLPATAITPQYRSDKSGTNGNFSGYLAANKVAGWVADQTWTNATKSTTPAGTGVAGSAGIVANLKSTAGSIGYVDLKDAKSGALKVAALKNAGGQFVLPSAAAASVFLANQPVSPNGFVKIDWAKSVPGGYNASLITYAIVNTGKARAKGAAVKAFMQYVLKTCVPANAANLGYVALSGGQATTAQSLLNLIK